MRKTLWDFRDLYANEPNYAERRRYGERVSTGFVESTVNTVVGKRFGKRQQMRWSKQGAHQYAPRHPPIQIYRQQVSLSHAESATLSCAISFVKYYIGQQRPTTGVGEMFRDFMYGKTGSVAVMTGLLMTVVVAATGMAVDFSRGNWARIDLQDATDAAALGLLKLPDVTATELDDAARDIVMANLGRGLKLEKMTVTAGRTDDGSIVVDAEIELQTNFLPIIGFPYLAVDAHSVATLGAGEYVDVYLMVDRSASTLIAQPGADMTAMLNLTRPLIQGTAIETSEPDGCAFACHSIETWQTDTVTFQDRAIANNIGLRSELVTDAAATLAATLLSAQGDNLRIGVIDFAEDAALNLAPSTDLAAIQLALDTSAVDYGRTHYHELFDLVAAQLGAQGSGKTASDPRKLLVLITDGVYSQYYTDGTTRPKATVTESFGPTETVFYELFDSTVCQPAITQGFDITVINALYFPMVNSDKYDNLVLPYAPDINDALQECVTDQYFEGSTTAQIESAFQTMAEGLTVTRTRIVD
jgi:Flp pilus assembly protein TadG